MFDLLINARSHQHLYDAVVITSSCCARMKGLDQFFVTLNISLVTAVSKIITVRATFSSFSHDFPFIF